jgi:hypothetical protein
VGQLDLLTLNVKYSLALYTDPWIIPPKGSRNAEPGCRWYNVSRMVFLEPIA